MQKPPSKRKELFAPVPVRVLADSRLTALDHRVLETVAYHDRFGRNGIGCSASHKRIALLVGAHITNVTKSLAKLISLDYLTAQKSGRDGRRRVYHVIYNDEDGEVFDGASTSKRMAPPPKLKVYNEQIAGAGTSLSVWENRVSEQTIYSHKGEYKKIDTGKGNSPTSSTPNKQKDLANLINLTSGKVSVRAREATDKINREIDAASDISIDHEPPGTIGKPSSAQPSPELLNSPFSRKARGEQ